MKIVINAIPLLSPLTGVGNYTYNLITEIQRLKPDFNYTYYYGYYTKRLRLHNESKRFYRLKEYIKKIPVLSSTARGLKHWLGHLQWKKYDIYFEPNFIPLNIKAKRIVTTVFDFSFYHHPEWHPRDRIEYFSRNFFNRIRKSDVIITISKYVEMEALEILNIKDIPIVTIHLGYNVICNADRSNRTRTEESPPYILCVGSIEPRKNLTGLLKAFLLLPEYIRKGFRLLLVGFKGWENEEIFESLGKLKGSVDYLGYVDNEMLADLYRNAACFIYPSFYEGFGLPPLEAMACGCPVVVSNVASLPEVCGDAAYYVDPYNVESIAEGMYKVLTDDTLRKSLIEKGLERVKLFSWEKSAKEHIKVFEEVLKS